MVSLARWCLSLQLGPEFTVVGLPVGSGGRSGSEVSRVALVAHVSRVRRVSVLHLGFEVRRSFHNRVLRLGKLRNPAI